jgi:hypothetical protein
VPLDLFQTPTDNQTTEGSKHWMRTLGRHKDLRSNLSYNPDT